MKWNFKPLFKLLIDRDIKKCELAYSANVSIATLTKMSHSCCVVNIDILVRICTVLNCTFDDIIEFYF